MKYLAIIPLCFGLVSCGTTDTLPNVSVGGVQVSSSGVSVGDENGSLSVGTDGTVNIQSDSGSMSVGSTGMTVTSGQDTVSVGQAGIAVGTGIKISSTGVVDISKDPEVQGIQEDIDRIFEDIGKEEK